MTAVTWRFAQWYFARVKRALLVAAGATLLLASPVQAYQVLGGGGKRGKATIYQGTCKYRVFGPRGVLQVGTAPPTVTGANTRRRTRRERTFIRYRAYVTDEFANGATLATSNWSSFIRVRQSQRRTWNGYTSFDMDWRGNYGLDLRIEWWNSKRMIGWRAYKVGEFTFNDQYNVGPFGPISSCYKYTNY